MIKNTFNKISTHKNQKTHKHRKEPTKHEKTKYTHTQQITQKIAKIYNLFTN